MSSENFGSERLRESTLFGAEQSPVLELLSAHVSSTWQKSFQGRGSIGDYAECVLEAALLLKGSQKLFEIFDEVAFTGGASKEASILESKINGAGNSMLPELKIESLSSRKGASYKDVKVVDKGRDAPGPDHGPDTHGPDPHGPDPNGEQHPAPLPFPGDKNLKKS